ncbi:hypothetical protein [Nocardioides nanhaiensis]|uniref:Uncharacterized protein n=1 Tax=Nocardioides nanhaiensis TaxID=1476871 RepID=A0ABP8WBK3_9ACTN
MLRFLLVVIVFAVAIYLVVRLMQERGVAPRSQRPVKRRPQPKPKPKIVAPDDDEDFLRDLDRRRLNPEDGESA